MRRALPSAQANYLWSRSRNVCAFPGCSEPLIQAENGGLVTIGEIAHIHAQSPGGPRYRGDLPPTEVDSAANCMVLCPKHHKVVDKSVDLPTAETLRAWKRAHESHSRDLPNPEFIAAPIQPTHQFLHREQLRRRIAEALAETGVAVLVGLSGSGKTQAAAGYVASAEEYVYRWWIRARDRDTLLADVCSIG